MSTISLGSPKITAPPQEQAVLIGLSIRQRCKINPKFEVMWHG